MFIRPNTQAEYRHRIKKKKKQEKIEVINIDKKN